MKSATISETPDTAVDPLQALRRQEQERATQAEQRRQQTIATYRQLLGRFDNPQPGDAQALADCAAVLALTSVDVGRDQQALVRAKWCEKQTLDSEKSAAVDATLNEEIATLAKLHRKTASELLELVPDAAMHRTLMSIRPFLLAAVPQVLLHSGAKPAINDPHQVVPLTETEPKLATIDPANYDTTTGEKASTAYHAHDRTLKADQDARKELADLRRNFPRVFAEE